jgi:HEAT repeat protein
LVRSTAARALGRIGTHEDRRRLMDLLSDPHWWVRHHAASALVALPSMNPGETEGLLAALKDRYAADALRQALAEKR